MAEDKKITELTELSTVLEQGDLIAVVDDPLGSPETKKMKKRNFQTRYISVEPFNMADAENHATGDGKAYLPPIPPDLNGLDLVYCHAECENAGTTNKLEVQIHNETQAVDMLTTTLQIDSAETGSDTAATSYAIDTANDDVTTYDKLRIDIDAIHDTPAQGLIITLGFG